MKDVLFQTENGLKSAAKAARNEIDGFLDDVFFKDDVLKKYEGCKEYEIGDEGDVQYGYEWGMVRGCYRYSDNIICVHLGDLWESLPYEELMHWKLYNVHPNEINTTEYSPNFRYLINQIVNCMGNVNKKMKNYVELYYSELIQFNGNSYDSNIFNLTHAGKNTRFLKKVVNKSTSVEELEMKIVTLNRLVIDSINTNLMCKLLDTVDGDLKYPSKVLTLIYAKPYGLNKDELKNYDSFINPLRSLELLKRFLLVDDFQSRYYSYKHVRLEDIQKNKHEFKEFITTEFKKLYVWEISKQDFENREYFENKINEISERTSNLKLLNKFRNETAAHGHSPKSMGKMNRALGLEEENDDYSVLFNILLRKVMEDIERIFFMLEVPY